MINLSDKQEMATEGAVYIVCKILERGIDINSFFKFLDDSDRFKNLLNDDDLLLAFMHDEGLDKLINILGDEFYGKVIISRNNL